VYILTPVAAKHADDFNKLLLALAGLFGVPFLVWRVLIASRQNTIALENVRNTLFSKAVDQLGATRERKVAAITTDSDHKTDPTISTEPNIEVRLGAIYALEKLAREDIDLHWPIMETLCAYIRENAGPALPPPRDVTATWGSSIPGPNDNEVATTYLNSLRPPSVDIVAALRVLGRRSVNRRAFESRNREISKDGEAWRLNLAGCHLALAPLSGYDFSDALFTGAVLLKAQFEHADLSGADFEHAHLEFAQLRKVRAVGSTFHGAYLLRTEFESADLRASDFSAANFGGANFVAVQFQFATFYRPESGLEALAERRNLYRSRWGNLTRRAIFGGADLDGALIDFLDLENAQGLTQEQIDVAYGNEHTGLPPGLTSPTNERWLTPTSSSTTRAWRRPEWERKRVELLAAMRHR
jgi:uncharacterized protein YjbI with pentapeptide repeats